MFRGMPRIFWIGMLIMFGWTFTFVFLEMRIPGLPLAKVAGLPAAYLYNWVLGLWLVNLLVAFLFYRSEEKREEKLAGKEEI